MHRRQKRVFRVSAFLSSLPSVHSHLFRSGRDRRGRGLRGDRGGGGGDSRSGSSRSSGSGSSIDIGRRSIAAAGVGSERLLEPRQQGRLEPRRVQASPVELLAQLGDLELLQAFQSHLRHFEHCFFFSEKRKRKEE